MQRRTPHLQGTQVRLFILTAPKLGKGIKTGTSSNLHCFQGDQHLAKLYSSNFLASYLKGTTQLLSLSPPSKPCCNTSVLGQTIGLTCLDQDYQLWLVPI